MTNKPIVSNSCFVKKTETEAIIIVKTKIGNEYEVASFPIAECAEAEKRAFFIQTVIIEYGKECANLAWMCK